MNTPKQLQKDIEECETEIVEKLNDSFEKLNKEQFNILSESIIDYIDELNRKQ